MTQHEGVKTYRGSCHCGAVRFEVDLDLSAGTTRCNCTYCSKSGWWGCLVEPSAFRVMQGADSMQNLGKTPAADRGHCKQCGIAPFGHGNVPQIGGEYYSVNLRCLDDVDLSGTPVRYLDGRHDTWSELGHSTYANPFGSAGGVA